MTNDSSHLLKTTGGQEKPSVNGIRHNFKWGRFGSGMTHATKNRSSLNRWTLFRVPEGLHDGSLARSAWNAQKR
jgi:hypothetical protein